MNIKATCILIKICTFVTFFVLIETFFSSRKMRIINKFQHLSKLATILSINHIANVTAEYVLHYRPKIHLWNSK